MTATFTWTPDTGAACDREPRVLSVKLGDGYEQRITDGINADLRKRGLTFSGRSLTEIDAISDFLAERGGAEAFYYTHPRDTQRLYLCRSWSVREDSPVSGTVTATFEEVPA